MSVLKLDHLLYFGFNIFDGVCFAVMELLNQVIMFVVLFGLDINFYV